MSKILIATLGGLAALLMWGVSDWFASKSSKKLGSREVNLTMQAVGLIIMVAVWLVSRQPLPGLNAALVLAAAALFLVVGDWIFIRGLSIGEAGIVVPLASTYALITILLTFLFLTFIFTVPEVLAMLVIVGGAVLLGAEKINWRQVHKSFSREASLALLTAVLWGVAFFLINLEVGKVAWQSMLVTTLAFTTLFAMFMALASPKKVALRNLTDISANKLAIMAGATITLGYIAFYNSAQKSGSALIPVALSSAAPLVTSILAAVFDKERIILAKRIGAVLVVAGVLLLNFK